VFYLGSPVVDNPELTQQFLESLDETVVDPEQLHVILFDNGSTIPYSEKYWKGLRHWNFDLSVIRSETNRGFYRPITDLADMATNADVVGLCHNDLIFYEDGWDRRLRQCFVDHGDLGIVGFCGSNEVDDRGGRGGGTMMNFKGKKGALAEHTGRKITDLQPAAILDSLFMAIRKPVVSCLGVDDNIALNHFGDRVWPLRAIEAGWRVGVLGVEIDHMGGQTLVLVPKIEKDSQDWLDKFGIPVPEGMSAGTAVYLESERRYLTEYRDLKRMIPGRVTSDWAYRRV
jgi:GT2 family glycosyltransferase